MFWKVSWITFNILQIPLWLYFWSMTKRFIVWLEVDSKHRNLKLFSLGIFYGLQIVNNIGSGIISPTLQIWGLDHNEDQISNWQNQLNTVNLYIFSFTTFLQSILILLILKEVHESENYISNLPGELDGQDSSSCSDSRNQSWLFSEENEDENFMNISIISPIPKQESNIFL